MSLSRDERIGELNSRDDDELLVPSFFCDSRFWRLAVRDFELLDMLSLDRFGDRLLRDKLFFSFLSHCLISRPRLYFLSFPLCLKTIFLPIAVPLSFQLSQIQLQVAFVDGSFHMLLDEPDHQANERWAACNSRQDIIHDFFQL